MAKAVIMNDMSRGRDYRTKPVELPSVDGAVKQEANTHVVVVVHKCKKCGGIYETKRPEDVLIKDIPYCPHCLVGKGEVIEVK